MKCRKSSISDRLRRFVQLASEAWSDQEIHVLTTRWVRGCEGALLRFPDSFTSTALRNLRDHILIEADRRRQKVDAWVSLWEKLRTAS
jgi:hypothetical protein